MPDVPSAARLLDFFHASARRPMTPEAVARRLEVPEETMDELEAALSSLAREGTLVRTRHGRFGLPERMNLAVGRLSCHPDGYAFLVRDDADGPDVFVPGQKLGDAMHEDRVVVRVEGRGRRGKSEGRVIRVLERARRRLVGTFERTRHGGWVMPRDPRLQWDVYVADEDAVGAGDGQVVEVEIHDYPQDSRSPEGRVAEVLGDADDARIDVEIVIRDHGLPHRFPEEVEREAERVPERVGERDRRGRTDFRDQPAVTIDGASAQDFDDAVHVERRGGRFRLTVHIADVSAYVVPGTAIDREARLRGTSVYFPRRVVPMLPEVLSNGICSLRPDEERLVQSVVMEIDDRGRTQGVEVHDGVIRSAARLTYEEVAAVLDGERETRRRRAHHVEHIEAMEALCRVLMEARRRRGGLDFDLPEPQVVIDMRGEAERIVHTERNIAHRIIEEFMVRTNEVVADRLAGAGHPCLYRIHEGPEEEKLEDFRAFVSGLGVTLGGGAEPQSRHFQRLIEHLEGRPEQEVVSMLLLSVMQQARYSPDNAGHFGLAAERYAHFTSPIRRYPDLVVHRLLRRQRGSAFAADAAAGGDLEAVGRECSRLERRAEEAEREYVDWKKVEFMADKVGRTFTGYVVSVQAFGLFVQMRPHLVTGLLHVSALGDDYYRHEPEMHRLVGESTGRTFDLGDTLEIRLQGVDPERRRLDLALADGTASPSR